MSHRPVCARSYLILRWDAIVADLTLSVPKGCSHPPSGVGSVHVTLESAATSTPAGSLVGRVIDGRYRLEEELGGGAAGSTHRARRAEDSRLVVVKLFDEDVSGDAVRRSRFEWEAATLAGLAHPNVLPILDYGVFAGRRYLVSEWLEGESLARRMRRSQLPLTTAVGIIRQVLAALASVHAARLAHRNLKPSDVYLEWRKQGRERVKLLDFAPVIRPRASVTQRGPYVPPEFATGEPLDARSDVYAVGALLSALLHGGPPDVPALAQPALPGARKGPVVDSTLQGWIRRAMARDPQDRFGDAAEMLQQLIDLLPRDLRSPPEGFEASRVSSVSIPSPVRSDTRRTDTSRSQTMRVDDLPTSTEPRPEPARAELPHVEPVRSESGRREVESRAVVGSTKEAVSPQTREAFARSERARAFIEARSKGRPRTQTPAGGNGPLPESPRASTTSAGWFVAEPLRRESLSDDDSPMPSGGREPVGATARDAQSAAMFRSRVQVSTKSDPAAADQARDAVTVERAIDAITLDIGIEDESERQTAASVPSAGGAIAAPPAPSSMTAAIPTSLTGSSAADRDAVASDAREFTKVAGAGVRARSAQSVRPPNRKARREAARREREATQTGLTTPGLDLANTPAAPVAAQPEPANVKVVRELARESTQSKRRERASSRPRAGHTADDGGVRDAVVGSVSRWFARQLRTRRVSPSLGYAALVGGGVLCLLAATVAGLRSFEGRETGGPGSVQTALDETSTPPAVHRRGAMPAVTAPSAAAHSPETTLAPSTASSGEAPAAANGDSDRVPAINPWSDPLPPELDEIAALANKGDPGDEPTIRRLRDYSRFSPDDPRGYLLLGRFYMNRYWRADALAQYQVAIDHDPAARGAPEIMRALLDLIVTGKATEEAEAFLLRVYGREALPAIEAELERLQRPMSIHRLSEVRSKLLDK